MLFHSIFLKTTTYVFLVVMLLFFTNTSKSSELDTLKISTLLDFPLPPAPGLPILLRLRITNESPYSIQCPSSFTHSSIIIDIPKAFLEISIPRFDDTYPFEIVFTEAEKSPTTIEIMPGLSHDIYGVLPVDPLHVIAGTHELTVYFNVYVVSPDSNWIPATHVVSKTIDIGNISHFKAEEYYSALEKILLHQTNRRSFENIFGMTILPNSFPSEYLILPLSTIWSRPRWVTPKIFIRAEKRMVDLAYDSGRWDVLCEKMATWTGVRSETIFKEISTKKKSFLDAVQLFHTTPEHASRSEKIEKLLRHESPWVQLYLFKYGLHDDTDIERNIDR